VDVDGAPDIPVQAGVEYARRVLQDSPNAKDNFEFERRLEFRQKSGAR
jgi:hypothetical protein